MVQTRRAHRKSRAGCDECKRRHIKCSEERPSCAHCLRHVVKCVYPSKTPARARSNVGSPSSDPRSSTTPSQQNLSSSGHHPTNYKSQVTSDVCLFTLSDLALLHHWTTVTSINIVHSPSVSHIWQSGFPQLAFNNGALMNRILSLSALHRAYLDPINRHSFILVATQHHGQAVKGLLDDLQDTGPEPGSAIFANAVLTFFYAFISFGPLYNDQQNGTNTVAHTSRILGVAWIPLIRGLEPVIERFYEQVASGPLGSFLNIHKWIELSPGAECDPDDQHLSGLEKIWHNGDQSNENSHIYDQALQSLRKFNMWLKQSETWQDDDNLRELNYGPWSGPFIWITAVPEAYFTFLLQRQPPAMIIFACYGALVHRLNHYWWMEGCGRSIVEAVDHCMGPYWSGYMDWAKQALEARTHTSIT